MAHEPHSAPVGTTNRPDAEPKPLAVRLTVLTVLRSASSSRTVSARPASGVHLAESALLLNDTILNLTVCPGR